MSGECFSEVIIRKRDAQSCELVHNSSWGLIIFWDEASKAETWSDRTPGMFSDDPRWDYPRGYIKTVVQLYHFSNSDKGDKIGK
jgi:hypothetical protein